VLSEIVYLIVRSETRLLPDLVFVTILVLAKLKGELVYGI
jgi:hypothetical protein